MEAADVVLVHNNLNDVYTAMDLSKKTFKRIQWNYFWVCQCDCLGGSSMSTSAAPRVQAMAYNLTAVPIAAGVLFPFTKTTIPPVFSPQNAQPSGKQLYWPLAHVIRVLQAQRQ